MAAKLLHSLTDDNPDLQKQIGCMTGIFQMFDRQQLGRRLIGHSHKRLLPPGNRSQFDNVDHDFDNAYNKQERARNKHINDKRVSAESSRASFSSSSRSSSFSSLDFGRISHLDPSLTDQNIFPETPSRDQVITQTGASHKLGRLSLDLRDVVKDSMYKEARGLSVQTTMKEGGAGNVSRNIDAPRPPRLSKSVDGSLGENSKLDLPSDLSESLKALAKLREAPWYCDEKSEDGRLSHDTKDSSSLFPVQRDAPRYSYDGRVTTSCFSFEPQDISRSNKKLRDLPRLSLDSRERCTKHIGYDPNNNAAYLSRNSQVECERCGGERVSTVQQQPSRPSSVVAKLMGLDTMPEPAPESKPLGLIKQPGFEDQSCSPLLPLKIESDVISPLPRSRSPRSSSRREPTSPRWKNADMKPVSSSKFPIEPAPWKHHHGGQASRKQAPRQVKTREIASNSSPSVYSEIEKRLKDLEFKQSGKDLRALKQILEAMQEKGLLGNPKEEPSSNVNVGTQRESQQSIKGSNMSAGLVNPYKLREDYASSSGSALGGAASSSSCRVFESPIVIMKPAKLVQKCGVVHSSSVLPIDCLHGVRSSHGCELANHTKYPVNQRRITRDLASRDARRDHASITTDKKANVTASRGPQSLARSQLVSKDNNAISSAIKSASSTTSPRLQQKKQKFDRRSCPSTPRQPITPDAGGKSRRQSIRQSTDAGGSPGGRRRPKALYTPENDDTLLSSVCNSSRKLNLQGSVVDLVQATDSRGRDNDMEEVASNSNEPSVEASGSILLSEVLLVRDMDGDDTETPTLRPREDILVEELGIALQHPNPVAVLDDSAYREDSPSPVKQTPQNLGGSRTKFGDEVCAQGQGNGDNLAPKDEGSKFTSEINQKKLQDIEELVQKLRRLNSSHDEAHTDYIASLCDNNHSNPDHRYISEILLASGLLLGDLSTGLATIQLHPSGNPINPELFFVLEQTKASNNFIHENDDNPSNLKLRLGKLKRKLIFDAVNEILATKLVSAGLSHEPWLKAAHKLAKKTLNAQKLLKELCTEVEELRGYSEKQNFFLDGEVEDADELKSILLDDVLTRSEDWTSLDGDVSVVVLDVERSIFKDLVDEMVIGEGSEAFGLGGKSTRRCSRQLFSTKV